MRSLITLSILVILTTAARSDPPPNGWMGIMPSPVVACDTKEEVKAIFEAGNKGPEEMHGIFMRYNGQLNAHGDPACVYGQLGTFATAESEFLGQSKTENGTMVNVWVIHAGNERVEFYILYPENVIDKHESGI
jgi:hypothetical protein